MNEFEENIYKNIGKMAKVDKFHLLVYNTCGSDL